MKTKIALLACVCVLALTPINAHAAEGGGIHYEHLIGILI